MAERDLIEEYLAELGRRLTPEVLEELADGLEESVRSHLSRGESVAAAHAAAVREFGRPDDVVAAFARQSPGRRTAVALLATGPVFAGLWGTALIEAKVWQWHLPVAVTAGFGIVLLVVAGMLLAVARSNNLGTARLAAPAGIALVLLDTAMLTAVLAIAPALTPAMAFAVPASMIRVTASLRILPRLLATGVSSSNGSARTGPS